MRQGLTLWIWREAAVHVQKAPKRSSEGFREYQVSNC